MRLTPFLLLSWEALRIPGLCSALAVWGSVYAMVTPCWCHAYKRSRLQHALKRASTCKSVRKAANGAWSTPASGFLLGQCIDARK